MEVCRTNGPSEMLMLVGLGGMPMRAARQFFTSTGGHTVRVGNAQCGVELGTQDPFLNTLVENSLGQAWDSQAVIKSLNIHCRRKQ